MSEKMKAVKKEISKAIRGKDDVIDSFLMSIIAGGHILLEDIPGVGKTTLALALSKAMGLSFNRVQFTPDVVPSDITGFSMFDRTKNDFIYQPGAAMCNLLLADEINRTSSKTQSALLEVMQEGKMTVDGQTHEVPKPFVVIATQNPIGTAGTQMLPEAQLDRFMVQLSMGYPDFQAQVDILKDRRQVNPLDDVEAAISREELIEVQKEVRSIHVDDKIYEYVTALTENTRKDEMIRLGVSPRGALAICSMAMASAYWNDRDYVVLEDVQKVFIDVANHRILLSPRSQLKETTAKDVLAEILKKTEKPNLGQVKR